jgi:hypothetical protein
MCWVQMWLGTVVIIRVHVFVPQKAILHKSVHILFIESVRNVSRVYRTIRQTDSDTSIQPEMPWLSASYHSTAVMMHAITSLTECHCTLSSYKSVHTL